MQETLVHARHQDGGSIGFDLHVADDASRRDRQSQAKVESAASGAEGQNGEGTRIHTAVSGHGRW